MWSFMIWFILFCNGNDITYEEHAFYTKQINESDVSFVYSCDFQHGRSRSTKEKDNPSTVSKIFEIKKFEIGLCVLDVHVCRDLISWTSPIVSLLVCFKCYPARRMFCVILFLKQWWRSTITTQSIARPSPGD
jgi:hypothetical protein